MPKKRSKKCASNNEPSTNGRGLSVRVSIQDHGIYHDLWAEDFGETVKDAICPELESLKCQPTGDLDELLTLVDNEIQKNLDELAKELPPEDEASGFFDTTAYAAQQWQIHLQEHLKKNDMRNAARAAFWLGVTLERSRVERIERFALTGKKAKKNLKLGRAARRRQAALAREAKRRRAADAVQQAEAELREEDDESNFSRKNVMKRGANSLRISESTLYRRLKKSRAKK